MDNKSDKSFHFLSFLLYIQIEMFLKNTKNSKYICQSCNTLLALFELRPGAGGEQTIAIVYTICT